MTIDVSKLKAGDEILLRATIEKIDDDVNVIYLDFGGESISIDTTVIVYCGTEILPAPFDWKDAKPGMAFYHREHDCIYIFESFSVFPSSSGDCVVIASPLHPDNKTDAYVAVRVLPDDLTRAQEHDIEVPEGEGL